jgi:hypothetical protein
VDAGFDAVVGNPPWERMNLEENEFFAAREPSIATAPTGARRKMLIGELPKTNPRLWQEYQVSRLRIDQQRQFVQSSDLFPLCGRGLLVLFEHRRDFEKLLDAR